MPETSSEPSSDRQDADRLGPTGDAGRITGRLGTASRADWLDHTGPADWLVLGKASSLNAEPAPAAPAVDPRRFRDVLGSFATGIALITAVADGEPVGMAVNSFTSVSLQPPLVAFCAAHSSSTWPKVRAAGAFAVNILGDRHEPVSRTFATKGADRFASAAWEPSAHGQPLLADALAWIDCSIDAIHPAGDHVIVVGRVLGISEPRDDAPLLFFRGKYARFATPEQG